MTGRYRNLSRPIQLATDLGSSAPRLQWSRPDVDMGNSATGYALAPNCDASTFGPIHRRTILFILIALFVGSGLLRIAPNLSASELTGNRTNQSDQPVDDLEPEDKSGTLSKSATEIARVQATSVQPPGTSPDASLAISPIFTPEVQHWAPRILAWSARYGLDPDIVATIMQIESCGHPGAASYAGAQGLFQVMPFHFAPGEDMLDPDTNAMRGLAFYNRQLEYTSQNIYLSFAGYNGGYAASGSSYPYWANETQRYYTWASGIYDEAKTGRTISQTLQRWLAVGGNSLCRQAAGRLGL